MTASRSRIRLSLEYLIVYLGCTVSGKRSTYESNVESRGDSWGPTGPSSNCQRLRGPVDTPSQMPRTVVQCRRRALARGCSTLKRPDDYYCTRRPPGRLLEHVE